MIAAVTMIVIACTPVNGACVRYVEPHVTSASCLRTAIEQQWMATGNVRARVLCRLEGKDV